MADNIKQLRERIDALDLEILKLVNERASAAHAIGKLKEGGTVYRPEREAQVLRRLSENNPGPLPDKVVAHVFTEVIFAEWVFCLANLKQAKTTRHSALKVMRPLILLI